MHGYELLVPFLIADRERKAKEARLAHLADEEPFVHQTTDAEIPAAEIPATAIEDSWMPVLRGWPYDASRVKREDPDHGWARSAATQPVLGRLINRFTGPPKTA
jgi:hypothetical protein